MEQLKQLSRLKRDRRIWIPYLILGVTLLMTGISSWYVARSARIREQFRFERAVQRTEDDIRNRLDTYTNLLRASSGLFTSTNQLVSREQFQSFVSRLELQQRYPGIQGIGFSIRVAPTEVEALVQQLQQQGDLTFRIRPDTPRTEYHSIIYLEPLDLRNQAAIGYDMFTEPTRQAAMAQARDTGLPTASGRVTLVQEIDRQKQAGFLIYFPIYRNGVTPATVEERRALLQGFVYSPFRVDDLLQGILGDTADRYVDFAIYDGTDLSPEQLLHHSQHSNYRQREKYPLRATRSLNVSGRTWTIVFASRPEIHVAVGHGVAAFVFLSGFIVSIVLFAVTRAQVRARIAAERAVADLRQSESQYRLIVETSQEGIWLINAQGQTEFVNPYLADMLGYSATEMIGRSLFEFMDEAAKTEAQLHMKQRKQGIGGLHDFRFRCRDGAEIWALVSANPIFNDQQEFVGALAMITDITERKRTEEALKSSEERFRKLTEKVRVIPWESSAPNGPLTYIGPQAVEILGYPIEAWYTPNFWKQHLHVADRDWVTQFCLSVAQTEENYEFEYRMIAADGRIVWLYDLVSVVHEEEAPKLLRGIMIDITDRKQAEAERIDLLKQAQKARTEAEVANRLKDEFLATLSHELRTPLNAMLGWSQLLRTRRFDEQTTQKALETIDRNTRLLNQLIADLLDVSRIMTGKFHLELRPISLAGVIQDAIAAVRSQAEAKQIQLKTQFDPSIPPTTGDYTRLQQIVWNLLTNAIKFTPTGGLVEVRLESGAPLAEQPDLPTVQLIVADTGQGIAADFLPHIFERFRQADGTLTRRHGGLGLGLAIVHHITTMHGGKIHADSPGQGKGATFTLTLPLRPPVPQPSTPPPEPPPQSPATTAIAHFTTTAPSLEGVRILLVDDEADARSLLTTMLQEYGAEVTAVESAQAAYAVIQAAQPLFHLLISDIGMPNENGYMLIQRIRNLSPRPAGQMLAIALTAYARTEDKEQAIAAGFQQHVAKPVIPEEFVTIVANLVGRCP